ncbi:MAG: hypothetical protein NZ700_08525 [Gemmataceae bacterium]|nr:hypothetical protein [Gemmataceae bacterium]MDW8266176.1 hypothetical protein [Gemmataceae bacterium]
MDRRSLLAAAGLLLAAGTLWADVVQGEVKSVDAEKSTITVTVSEKDLTFFVAKDARIYSGVTKGKRFQSKDVPGGLRGIKPGATVVLTVTETRTNGLETVTQVQVKSTPK